MILEPQEGKVCRNPHRVLAFLVICLNPSLAFLGARKFIFIKNYRNICYPPAGQTKSNDVNSNSSIIVLRLLRDRGTSLSGECMFQFDVAMAGDVKLALQQIAAVTLDRTIHPV